MKTFKEFVAEAISRKPSVQRAPDLSARARQQRQAREDRRAEARDRVSDKIDALIGSDEERSAAAAARKKQPEIQRELRRKSTRDRMAAAAKKLGLDEAKDETEIGITGQPIPKKRMSAAKRYEFEKKRRENLKKKPGESGDSKLIQALRDKAKREGTFAESRTKEQQIKGQQAMLDQKIKDEYDKVTKEVPRTTKYLKK